MRTLRPMLARLATVTALVAAAAVAACDTATTLKPCQTTGSCSPGGGGNPGGSDTARPVLFVDTPSVNQAYNVGDTIRVFMRVQDGTGMKSIDIQGLTITGDSTLGTQTIANRYRAVTLAVTGTGRNNILRGLVPLVPLDTTIGTMIIRVTATNTANNTTVKDVPVLIKSLPKLTILAPRLDSIAPGGAMTVKIAAQQLTGLDSLKARVQSGTGWPTALVDSAMQFSAGRQSDTLTQTFSIPATAPAKGSLTVTALARDQLGQVATRSVTIYICGSCGTRAPIVTQEIPGRLEYADAVPVSASGNSLAWVGLIVSDSVDSPASIRRDSVAVAGGPSNTTLSMPIFPASMTDSVKLLQQGRHLRVRSFARDAANRVGYSVVQGIQVPVTDPTLAHFDTTLVAYGRTYTLPRPGVVGDVAVDTARGNVYLSNTSYNLLELFNVSGSSWRSGGVQVGALPWGLFVSNNPDTLLVANSGATTVSRVYIGSADPTQVHEDLSARIRTRNSYVYEVYYTKDNTAKVHLQVEGPFSYSDRPQYVAESKAGRLYFSTRPTFTAPEGTVRWMDPTRKYADAHQIHSYVPYLSVADLRWVVFNADSVKVRSVIANPDTVSDQLIVWDHWTDTTTAADSAMDANPETALLKLQNKFAAQGHQTDMEMVFRLDRRSIGLTDTTFAAASGDRNWVAFGEGNTKGQTAGRLFMSHDPSAAQAPVFSPLVTTSDLTENASEKVNGVAIDSIGRQIGSHGLQSYVAAVDDPFHLRLEGVYDSFDNGAGISFGPGARGPDLTNQRDRVVFVASQSGSIEVVDAAYFNNRGTLPTKGTLYGPLRATRPLTAAERARGIVMKLYALTPNGLVVIDLTKRDIKDAP